MKAIWAAVAAFVGWSSVARADVQASPQYLMFEVKFGPYVPHIDRSIGLGESTPFSDVFGDPSSGKGSTPAWGLLGQGELDYQFFHRFGVLGVGISAGYHYRTAKSFGREPKSQLYCQVQDNGSGGRRYVPTATEVTYNDCISDDEDKLNVVPMSVLLSYRFDVLDRRFGIPIIPYVKVGLAYYAWWFGNSSSYVSTINTTDSNGQPKTLDSSGGSLGLVVHPGLALNLSALDPSAARAIDQEVGLNRVTLFVELNYSWVNGFGRPRNLDLSDTSLSAGLGFEF
jgi:hypothetical protein